MNRRQIHLVWLGSAIPGRVTLLKARLEELHPEAAVRLWRDDDLTWMTNHEHLLREPRMSGKADIARFEILLEHGGIYLDCDFSVHRSMGAVFDAIDEYGFVTARQSRSLFNPAFIGSRPGHEILRRLVAGIPATSERFMTLSAVARTGPHYFTEVLMSHLRAGGRFGELPQHSTFPWYSDEAPLPSSDVPSSVIVSHEWATMTGVDYWSGSHDEDREPVRRSWLQSIQERSSLRARAARSATVHNIIERIEGGVFGGGAATRLLTARPFEPEFREGRDAENGHPRRTASPTDMRIDSWCSRLVAQELRGSASFLDVAPTSFGTFLTALRVLDRPGRALVATPQDNPPPASWRDASVRCSAHVLSIAAGDSDDLVGMESEGSALRPREVSRESGPLGFRSTNVDTALSELVASVPRFALVRCSADCLSLPLGEVLAAMLQTSRIKHLLLTVDPASASPGVSISADLIRRQAESGRSVSIGPWLVDGRGREWDEHFRVAARPFVVSIR
jgi:hypothetical protein